MEDNGKDKKLVQVKLLGEFSLTVEGTTVLDEKNHMNKLWFLLAYLVYHRDRIVPQSEFIEKFWAEGTGASPENALKTQIFRIRKKLEPLFEADSSPILSYRGGYQWNPAIQTRVDVHEFEAVLQRGNRLDNAEAKREAILSQAESLYGGDFLSKNSNQAWAKEIAKKCRAEYLNTVEEYASHLKKSGSFEHMLKVLQKAAHHYPLEEQLHTGIVRAWLGMGKHTEALAHYTYATDLLYRNLGVQPWKELRNLYDQIMAREQHFEADLTIIQEDLEENGQKEGAFFCEYACFREIYRLEARCTQRNRSETHIILLTILNVDGSTPQARVLEKAMEQTKDVILHFLRKGDVFTQYSSGQYLMLLPQTTVENAEMIKTRITSKLWRFRSKQLKLSTVIRKLVSAQVESSHSHYSCLMLENKK